MSQVPEYAQCDVTVSRGVVNTLTAEPTPSCYDYCEAWFGAGTPGHQCYNCYGANKCVDVAGSHCYYADNGTATCTAAGHIYC